MTLNKCIESIEIQVFLIKKVLSIDFSDEATCQACNQQVPIIFKVQMALYRILIQRLALKSSALQFAFILTLVFYAYQILIEGTDSEYLLFFTNNIT